MYSLPPYYTGSGGIGGRYGHASLGVLVINVAFRAEVVLQCVYGTRKGKIALFAGRQGK